MAYTTLINDIKAVIKNNGNQEITGQVLQTALVEMVNELGSGYTYKGVATLSTTPDVTTPNIFYLLGEAGTYTNIGGIQHTSGIGIAIWNGTAWSYQNVPSSAVVATDATPTENSTNPVQSGGVYEELLNLDDEIGTKTIEISPSWETNKYYSTKVIGSVPTQGTANSWSCARIQVKKGEKYTITGKGGDSPRLWAIADADGKVLSYCPIGSTANPITQNIEIGQDGYVYINMYLKADSDGIWRTSGGLDAKLETGIAHTEAMIEESVDSINVQMQEVAYENTYIQSIPYELGNISITVSTNTATYSDSTTRVRTPQGYRLHLFAGDTIGLSNYTDARFYVGWWNVEGTTLKGARGWLTEDFTIIEEGIYCILVCNLTDTAQTSAEALGSLIKVRRNKTISTRIENQNGTCNIEGALTPQRGYIKYSDGSFNNTGSLIYVYQFSTDGIEKVKVFVTAADSVPAAIAFYSSSNISTSTYIGGVQMRANTSGGNWYEAEIPSNAKLVAITNHSSYCPQPTIIVDNINTSIIGTDGLSETIQSFANFAKSNTFTGNNPFRFGGQFFAHMFLGKIYQDSTNIVIPSESLADVRVARRMGFNVIEANVQTTSDGKYIVIHGSAGTFGYEVTDLNGDFTYADTAINTKTLDWIKTNIRYRSDIARYRTAIPTLEEFLTECRISGMIPLAQASTSAMVSVLDKYMGYGNYIAYNGTRALTNAPILTYHSLTTKEEILAKCRSYGVPYIYSMGNMAAFTDEELADIVQSLHAEGYMIATAYISFYSGNRAIKLGFDIIASDSFVPHIDCGNICNYGADATFSDFNVSNATINDSVITMTGSATITPKNITDSVFIGVGELRVVYNGTIVVNLRGSNQTMTSDGVNEQVFSTYYINEVPTFTISGTSTATTISDITFRASKV